MTWKNGPWIEYRKRYGSVKGFFMGRSYKRARAWLVEHFHGKALRERLTVLRKKWALFHEMLYAPITPERYERFAFWRPKNSKKKRPRKYYHLGQRSPDYPDLIYLAEESPDDPYVQKALRYGRLIEDARNAVFEKFTQEYRILEAITSWPVQPEWREKLNWVPPDKRDAFVPYAAYRVKIAHKLAATKKWWIDDLRTTEMQTARIFVDVLRSLLLDKPHIFGWKTVRTPSYLRKDNSGGNTISPSLFDLLRFHLTYFVGMDLYWRIECETPGANRRSESVLHTLVHRDVYYVRAPVMQRQFWRERRLSTGDDFYLLRQRRWQWDDKKKKWRKGLPSKYDKETYKSVKVLEAIERYRPWIALIATFVLLFEGIDDEEQPAEESLRQWRKTNNYRRLCRCLYYFDDVFSDTDGLREIMDKYFFSPKRERRYLDELLGKTQVARIS